MPIWAKETAPNFVTPPCVYCEHWTGGQTCKAFPGMKIPHEITTVEFDHRRNHPQDNGIVFSPSPNSSPDDVTRLFSELEVQWARYKEFGGLFGSQLLNPHH
jgi:hypothetical protein